MGLRTLVNWLICRVSCCVCRKKESQMYCLWTVTSFSFWLGIRLFFLSLPLNLILSLSFASLKFFTLKFWLISSPLFREKSWRHYFCCLPCSNRSPWTTQGGWVDPKGGIKQKAAWREAKSCCWKFDQSEWPDSFPCCFLVDFLLPFPLPSKCKPVVWMVGCVGFLLLMRDLVLWHQASPFGNSIRLSINLSHGHLLIFCSWMVITYMLSKAPGCASCWSWQNRDLNLHAVLTFNMFVGMFCVLALSVCSSFFVSVQTYIPNLYWKTKEIQKKFLHDSFSDGADRGLPSSSCPSSSSSSSALACPNPYHPYSLTTDLWSGPDHETYICLTAHWLDKDWDFRRALLDIYLCTDRHLGDNICDWVKQVLNDNELVVCCVWLSCSASSLFFPSVESWCCCNCSWSWPWCFQRSSSCCDSFISLLGPRIGSVR